MAKFSIIIPVYNVEKYLGRCMDSILSQSFIDFEVILVNDGSKDSSLRICEEYASLDNRIKVINKKNGGATSARKVAAAAATGEYILCVDGDDYIPSESLSILNNSLNQDDSIDVLCFGYKVDKCGSISDAVYNLMNPGEYCKKDGFLLSYLYDEKCEMDNSGGILYSLWTKVVKRNLYLECQNLVPDGIKNGEDILLIAIILSKSSKIKVINSACYYYCYNPTSTTAKRSVFDLKNVGNVRDQLYLVESLPHNNIEHYYLASLFTLSRDLAKSNNYAEFKKCMNNFDQKQVAFRGAKSLRTNLKFKIINKRLWGLEYFLVRIKLL